MKMTDCEIIKAAMEYFENNPLASTVKIERIFINRHDNKEEILSKIKNKRT